jgi:hypothetical protein
VLVDFESKQGDDDVGKLVAGTVTQVRSRGSYDIDFDDGDSGSNIEPSRVKAWEEEVVDPGISLIDRIHPISLQELFDRKYVRNGDPMVVKVEGEEISGFMRLDRDHVASICFR